MHRWLVLLFVTSFMAPSASAQDDPAKARDRTPRAVIHVIVKSPPMKPVAAVDVARATFTAAVAAAAPSHLDRIAEVVAREPF